MEIRVGCRYDAGDVAALHAGSWRTAYAGIMPDDFLAGPLLEDRLTLWLNRLDKPVPGAALFVAETATGIDGFAYVVPTSDGRVLLDNLHARPGRTGAGIGGRLLAHALAWAADEHPGKAVYLEVLRANTRAVAFYERHGAVRTDERVCRFEQGFALPELEYSWLGTSPA